MSFEERERAKYVVVLGQTGSGKTTQINSLINYVLGVQYNDDYRYQLVFEDSSKTEANSQADSQTTAVNIYGVWSYNNHPPLVIIDSPGYGDTRGIDKDGQIDTMIQELFEKLVDRIHAICFVIQSSNIRLTATQKYGFSKVMQMFGPDIAENFLIMLTFCDGGEPQIVSSLQDQKSILANVIKDIRDPWFLKFNNSAVFEKNDPNNLFNRMFWDLSINSMKTFMIKLRWLPEKSLQMSKDVIRERK